MEFVSETGYYDRTVTMRCKCGKHVVYGGWLHKQSSMAAGAINPAHGIKEAF
jgi:hypothetical protein